MQKMKITFKITVIFLSLLVIGVSFAHAKYLKTLEAKAEEISGSFTLILYDGRHVNDLETTALLDREGDQYEFEPYAPEFDYKVKKGVPAGDALNEAKKFVSFHNAFWRSQLSKILDDKGDIIGYELRPLYHPFVYGRDDLLEVYYRIKDGKVIVYIRLAPEVFSKFLFGDLPGSSSAGH
jgi:hypothetical protein